MTRRTVYHVTAEIMSRALLTREKYGQDAAFRAAADEGVEAALAATVLMRADARIALGTPGRRSDRRLTQRPQS
jgi:hypothetical protein